MTNTQHRLPDVRRALSKALQEYGDPIRNRDLREICEEAGAIGQADLSRIIYEMARREPEWGVVRVRHATYQWVGAAKATAAIAAEFGPPTTARPGEPEDEQPPQVLHDFGDHLLLLYRGKAWKAVEVS